jgi:hypothetical protein
VIVIRFSGKPLLNGDGPIPWSESRNGTTGSPPDTVRNRLSDRHLEDLRKSGLSDETILAYRFRTVSPDVAAKDLGWSGPPPDLGWVLAIPYWTIDREPSLYSRYKPDKPRVNKGKEVKYEAPVGIPPEPYFPPGISGALNDPTKPLLITEGEKKAAKAVQEGFPCIGVSGVWSWQKKRSRDEYGQGTGDRELVEGLDGIP